MEKKGVGVLGKIPTLIKTVCVIEFHLCRILYICKYAFINTCIKKCQSLILRLVIKYYLVVISR